MASLSKKTIGITAGVIVVLGVAIAAFAFSGGSNSAVADNGAKNYSVYQDDMTEGHADAPVTVIEYLAATCPHCARFNIREYPKLKKQYIDTGKVRYVMRVLPLNPVDAAVEIVARCQPKNKYFAYYNYLFKRQKEWDPEYGIKDVGKALHKVSDEFGIPPEAFDRCLNEHDISDEINRRAQDGEMRYHLKGTPTFVVNGKVVLARDAMWDKFKARLDKLLAAN